MSDLDSPGAIAAALHRLEPLRDVPADAIAELVQITSVARFGVNEAVFRQGEAVGSVAWLLLSGRMSVRVATGPQQRIMTDVWPGEIVGEAALYAKGPTRSATVLTTAPAVALTIPRSALFDHPDQPALIALEMHLLETMAKRLRSTNNVLQCVVNEQRAHVAEPPRPASSPADAPRAAAPRPARPEPPERLSLAQRLARWFDTAD
jgi:CRP-like cAMP-binding protein